MLQSEAGDYWGYNIRMDGVFRVDHNDEREELGASDNYHALLDTGFTGVHVPERILSKLAGSLSRGYINRTTDQLYASCIYHSLHKFGGLEFHFGNSQIMVPWDALFYPPVNNTHSVCETKLSGSEFANQFTLGMPFFQHSYVVHDLVRLSCFHVLTSGPFRSLTCSCYQLVWTLPNMCHPQESHQNPILCPP